MKKLKLKDDQKKGIGLMLLGGLGLFIPNAGAVVLGISLFVVGVMWFIFAEEDENV